MKKKRKQIPTKAPVKKKKQNPKKPTGIPELPVTKAEVRERVKGKRVNVKHKELKMVAADTLERLGYYRTAPLGTDIRGSCEQLAEVLVREMKYGLSEDGRINASEPISVIIEEEYRKVPLCKEHK